MSFIDTLMSSVALGSSEVASEMMMKIDILHVLDTSVCAPTHSAVVLMQGREFKSSLQTFILGCSSLCVT